MGIFVLCPLRPLLAEPSQLDGVALFDSLCRWLLYLTPVLSIWLVDSIWHGGKAAAPESIKVALSIPICVISWWALIFWAYCLYHRIGVWMP